jgi:hypothetical protein
MNNEQQELLDEAYKNYGQKIISEDLWMLVAIGWPSNQEEFINKCKTDTEFSEKWGLKFEERELSLEERTIIFQNSEHSKHINLIKFKDIGELNKVIPTKLITITYNDTKLESYE